MENFDAYAQPSIIKHKDFFLIFVKMSWKVIKLVKNYLKFLAGE